MRINISTDERCLTCVLRDDWLDKGKCYADLEFHADDDRCDFWAGSLRDEPVNGPEARLVKNVAEQDKETEG